MHNPWGLLVTAIGLLIFLGGLTESNFILYRLITARSRLRWGDHVHRFSMVAGTLMAIFGALVAFGLIGR
ncbi:hypothetical protein SV7mr_04280 [Stieleria bergensis]|uniref:Uncharacterized protein n=1 Tax=Stieleria bergensis TaxID=2528025 RepID=A0A517SP96_9BACT|nr:hypothetical protein SV7mr_04280 [Planctomycetes bacterium SV_7m_r]